MWVQPGDIDGLKMRLVKLLELFGGHMPLTHVPSEYQKIFGRPLYVSEYGVFKLVNLFNKMSDAMAIDGKAQKKFVYLRNRKAGPSAPPVPLASKVKRENGSQEECIDVVIGNGFSDEFSDEEKAMIEEHDEMRNEGSFNMRAAAWSKIDDYDLGQFHLELQEILVSY
ncbi:Endonuclease or glycosyl hydrolase [Tripterygium wilfordii]|uniref:Endonuclease or glycosyl hydrolase n=1 Tax=Tripterygium wilfordii TaxID=458696 RepID=A0A7J7DGW7_TRIWF|nr:Endonuclease or glycosyl hydrolase [Tripterygium wilfordii]